MEIKVADILKVIDISYKDVSEKTVDFLNNNYCEYKDQVGKENLLNIVSANEEDAIRSNNRSVRSEIETLGLLASRNDAAYVRFIYT